MADYKIKAVKDSPKEWDSRFGPMVTYLIQVEGNGEPVQLNKKADSPAPKVGDEISGEISDTEYGQKFKAEYKANNSGFKKSPETEENIARAVALKASVELWADPENSHAPEDVIETAEIFLAWLQNKAVADIVKADEDDKSEVKKKAESWVTDPPKGEDDPDALNDIFGDD